MGRAKASGTRPTRRPRPCMGRTPPAAGPGPAGRGRGCGRVKPAPQLLPPSGLAPQHHAALSPCGSSRPVGGSGNRSRNKSSRLSRAPGGGAGVECRALTWGPPWGGLGDALGHAGREGPARGPGAPQAGPPSGRGRSRLPSPLAGRAEGDKQRRGQVLFTGPSSSWGSRASRAREPRKGE